jgi:pimeloyl-ACP methyl ester carboxylesterase
MCRKYIIFIAILFSTAIYTIYAQYSSTAEANQKTFHHAAARSPEPGMIFLYPERIRLKEGGFYNAERGMMFVPVNRSKQNSAVIAVEVYRFRASEKANPRTPPIFYLHGGPSFGGLERPLEQPGTFEERWRPFLDISDVVVVSQRGIGPSKPTTVIETTTKPLPPDQPYDDEKAVREFQQVLAKEKAAWEKLGLDLSGFTVVEAAADVNDVRKALGYHKIVIWGGSFGSHWAMAIMRYYPETVERAILRGMEGPDHTYDHPGHLWNVYKRVAEEAEKSPRLKGLIPEGGLITAIETVIKRGEKKPFKVTVIDTETNDAQDVLFDRESIKRLSRGYSGDLSAWPADVITLYNGDFSKAAEKAVHRYKTNRRRFITASFFMLDCGSGITAKRLAEYNSDPALKILSRMNWGYTAGCSVWGSDLGDEFRQNFEIDIPTVIVHGTWDTSTPYENALELVPYFKNSKFIPVIRGPHGAIRAALEVSEQFKQGIMKFAETGDMSGLPDKVEMPPVKWVIPGQTKGSN